MLLEKNLIIIHTRIYNHFLGERGAGIIGEEDEEKNGGISTGSTSKFSSLGSVSISLST